MGHEKGALPSRTATTNLLALDEEGMGRLVQQFGWPRYRTGQILRWLYQRRAKDINQMTNLGQAERTALASRAIRRVSRVFSHWRWASTMAAAAPAASKMARVP